MCMSAGVNTVCPGSSDPFNIASSLYKMGHYFLDILYITSYHFLFLAPALHACKPFCSRLNRIFVKGDGLQDPIDTWRVKSNRTFS